MINFTDVCCTYKDSEEAALQHINLTISKGECLLIAGESGSGKSTILKIISGLIPHLYDAQITGSILINGEDIRKKKSHELASLMGVVNQDPRGQFFTSEVVTELAFAPENLGYEREKIIAIIKRESEKMKIEGLLDRPVFDLSSGEKQRVSVACAQSLMSQVFLFDEPSSNLDYGSTMGLKKIIQNLKEAGHTVVIAEHRVFYLLDVVDRIVYVKNGALEEEALNGQFSDFFKTKELRCPEPFASSFLAETASSKAEEPLLKVEGLSYQGILNKVSFEVCKGEVVAIIGQNGAGKTTLAKACAGVIKKHQGSIKRSKLMLVMQDVDYQLFTESVESELTLGLKNPCSVRIEEAMAEVGITELRKRHPLTLSGGQKQRVLIATAKAGDYDTVIFDEPTSGLDLKNMKKVADLIKSMRDERGIVLITHDFELIAQIATRVLWLEGGAIADDFPVLDANRDKLVNIFNQMEWSACK